MSDTSNRIRKFRVRDLDTIIEIERVSFKDPYSRTTFYFFYRGYPDTFWVYEEEEGIIGYIMFIPEGHIVNIAVAPNYRHKGTGTELMKFAIDNIVSKRVWLEVRESNIGAQKFYQKLGFKKEEVIHRYYGQEDAYILVLDKREKAPWAAS
jgi:ribosomal-protein-alanine N-acetyltransferase